MGGGGERLKKTKTKPQTLRYVSESRKKNYMEKSRDPDTTGKDGEPRTFQHSLYRNVSCVALIVVFILNSPSCAPSAGVSRKAAGIDCG